MSRIPFICAIRAIWQPGWASLLALVLLLALSPALWSAEAKPMYVAPTAPATPTAMPEAVPAATAADWQAAAPAAAAANAEQAKQTSATAPEGFWQQTWAWVLGAMGVALAIAKAGGRGNPLAHLLTAGAESIWTLLASRTAKEAENRRDALAAGMTTAMQVLEELPPEVTGPVKAKLGQRLPAAARDAVNAWIHERQQAAGMLLAGQASPITPADGNAT